MLTGMLCQNVGNVISKFGKAAQLFNGDIHIGSGLA
jgi:hypothetical protein